MDRLYNRLVRMPYWEAHNHLMTLDLPVSIRMALMAKANDERIKLAKEGKIAKLIHIHHAELWYRLLAPLKYELSNAKVGLRLKPADAAPERHAAFSAYVKLLEKLLGGLQKLRTAQASDPPNARTPTELASELNLPNKGSHWTDWVSDKTRTRIELLFDAIPPVYRAKRIEPFKRRIPPKLFKRDVGVLQQRTFKELDILRQEIEIARKIDCMTHDQRKHLETLEQKERNVFAALRYMTYKMNNEPVPGSWNAIELDGPAPTVKPEIEAAIRQQLPPPPDRKQKKTNRPKRYNV